MRYLSFVLLLVLSLTVSCGDDKVYVLDVMQNYQMHFEDIATGIRTQRPQKAQSALKKFKRFNQSRAYREWLNFREEDSQTRYQVLDIRLTDLQRAFEQNEPQIIDQAFQKVRDTCLNCHLISRGGIKRSFLEEELPDLAR